MKMIHDIRRENGRVLMKARNLRIKDVADLMGKDHTYISAHLGNRKNMYRIGSRFARELEKTFDVPEGYMDTEHTRDALATLKKLGIAPPAETIQVPLLDWQQLPEFIDGKLANIETTIYSAFPLPTGSFALTVESDAMTSLSPQQASYPRGSIIYVSMEDTSDIEHAAVIAKTKSGYLFRLFNQESTGAYLTPINMQYPAEKVSSDVKVIGIVKGQYISSNKK